MSKQRNSNDPWLDNFVQFARLLAEIHMVAELTPVQLRALGESMDLAPRHLDELFERAMQQWEQIKQAREPARRDTEAARSLREAGDLLSPVVPDSAGQNGLLELMREMWISTFDRAQLNYRTLSDRTASRLLRQERKAMDAVFKLVTGRSLSDEEYNRLTA